jgi:hypothetical protein
MAHGHSGAFDLDCAECQILIDGVDRHRRYRSNLDRPGRVAPPWSRVIGEGMHSPACLCRQCSRARQGPAAWAWQQFWEWTPFAQFVYWWVALYLITFS